MKKSKLTKKALLSSILVILMSITMLIGTTFAWFTDTASTSVNKIQAGNLNVDIVDTNGYTLEGKTLNFEKSVDAPANEEILWEPGVTFKTPVFKIKSTGNLALKYKLILNGVNGDNELLDVIKFSVIDATGAEVNLDTYVGHLTPTDSLSGALYIKAHMDEEAGNKYQGLSLEGLGITVVATQDTVEYDSEGNDYDKDAKYPVYATAKTVSGKDTIIQDKKSNPTIKAVVPKDTTDASELALIEELTETPSNIEISTGESTISLDVKIVDTQTKETISVTGESFFTIDLQIGQVDLIKFYHKDTELTKVDSKDKLTSTGLYYYDIDSGIVTYTTQSFSPFTAKIKYSGGNGSEAYPYLIANGEQAYQMRNGEGNFKLVNDVVVINEIYISKKTVVLDLNGHTIKLEYADNVTPNNGGVLNVTGKNTNLTINDSSIEQTGAVIGSSKSYTSKVTSAVYVGNYGNLTINGGHFYGMSEGTSCIFVKNTKNKEIYKATVTINGGKFETASPYNNIYYVLNHQNNTTKYCTMTVNGGSFKNYNPGVTLVDPENAGKISLGEGCKTTEKVVNNDTWYTVSK